MSEHWCPIHKTKFFKTANMKSYAHPVKDADGNTTGWCNEADVAKAHDETPQPEGEAKARTEWAPNPEKQASIEAQNARTALTTLLIAGKLTEGAIKALDPLEIALVAQLCDRAGVAYRGFKDKQGELRSPMVEAAKDMGAVEKPKKGQFASKGAFLNRCYKELGLQRPDVEEKIGPIDDITDFDGAWLALNNSL